MGPPHLTDAVAVPVKVTQRPQRRVRSETDSKAKTPPGRVQRRDCKHEHISRPASSKSSPQNPLVASSIHNGDSSSPLVGSRNVRSDSMFHALIGRYVADRFDGSARSAGDLRTLPHRTASRTVIATFSTLVATSPDTGPPGLAGYDPTPPAAPTAGSTPDLTPRSRSALISGPPTLPDDPITSVRLKGTRLTIGGPLAGGSGELCGHSSAEFGLGPEVDDGGGHGFGGVE